MKKLPFIMFLIMLAAGLSAATVAEVNAAKDVAAVAYKDHLSIVDLKTGAEATVFANVDLTAYQWDKQGKNLYAIASVNIPGPDYYSPSRDEVQLYEITLPEGKSTLLKTIQVPTPEEYAYYAYSNLFLDQSGNPVVLVYFSDIDSKCLKYTYNVASKVLGAPVEKDFNSYSEGYRRNGQAAILTEGKYYSKKDRYQMNLYTLNADGQEIAVTDLRNMEFGTSALDEPLRYCVAQDSSFIIVSFRWDREFSLGCSYAISTNDHTATLLSDLDYLGKDFIPLFTNEGKIPFYQPTDTFKAEIIPALKCVGKNGVVSVLKEWPRDNDAPLSIKFRTK